MSEELQRYRIETNRKNNNYEGESLGKYEHYILGNTTLSQLKGCNIIEGFKTDINYEPDIWEGEPSDKSKPDEIILDDKEVLVVVERKKSEKLNTPKKEKKAAEQCLVYLQQLNGKLGVITDYNKFIWIHNMGDQDGEIHYIYEEGYNYSEDYRKDGIIQKVFDKLNPDTDSIVYEEPVDPSELADSVWQTIWLATHEEPKPCLSTFVELFVYKFLSDLNLLPDNLSMEELNCEEKAFKDKHGKTQIEFYVDTVRTKMKELFPEDPSVSFPIDNFKKGSDTTSIIDGFVFIEPGMTSNNHPLSSFNHSFLDIISSFTDFGKIRKIDKDFKSRVYEKFLKKNVKQQKLGQYLTPRNIVKAIVAMANMKKLQRQENTSICDPACGVGGFLLEPLLHDKSLKGNLNIVGDDIEWKTDLVGLEVDRQTNILSKANMLIHLAEKYTTLNEAQKDSFAKLMNETFILSDHDKMLGSLEFPQDKKFDLIMTNPPFVVEGTRVIKNKIRENEDLRKRYNRAGTGIESLFIRWIVDALKPGGRAFVIVPTGILSRSETAVRSYIREHCIVDGIVYLPERTFYNTPNPTYILTFTKKITEREGQHPNIFAYMVREVGETRDAKRFECRSDLPDLIRQFRAFYADKDVFEPRNLNCKIIKKDELKPEYRWDINRFWSEKEKKELGIIEAKSSIGLSDFESLVESMFTSVKDKIEELKGGVEDSGIKTKTVKLGNSDYFKIIRGKRITKSDIHNNPGDIPVISGRKRADSYLGHISEEWLKNNNKPIYLRTLVTINSNGAVGEVFLRELPKYTIHDDVTAIDINIEKIDFRFLVYSIRQAIADADFRYDAKLYKKRLKRLEIKIPVDEEGNFDLDTQERLALNFEKLNEIKESVKNFNNELENKFITAETLQDNI